MKEIHTTATFDKWFERLKDKKARAKITVRVSRLAEGNPGKIRNLTKGVAEMKIDFGPGYRVYYVERNGITYILLCGGDKNSQKKDIETALEMANGV